MKGRDGTVVEMEKEAHISTCPGWTLVSGGSPSPEMYIKIEED